MLAISLWQIYYAEKKNQEKQIFLMLPVEFEHKVIRYPPAMTYPTFLHNVCAIESCGPLFSFCSSTVANTALHKEVNQSST